MSISHIRGKIVVAVAAAIALAVGLQAQPAAPLATGERLTYHMAFDRFENVGFAELQVVSAGRLADRDVVELRSKFKTLDLVSAVFFLVDETRTTFVAPDTGLPVYITKVANDGPLPRETTLNFLRSPAFGYDLPSLIYQARLNGGAGTYPLYEGGKQYSVTFDPGKSEHIRVDAGEFDTIATAVESDFLTSHGMKDAVIDFSNDSARIPVRITLKLRTGIFRITLASVSRPEAGSVIVPVSTPLPAVTPTPVPTPRTTPSPAPYVDNRPLPLELNFNLGESLDYRVTSAGQPAGVITLSAKDRRQVNALDTLFLSAVVTSVDPGSRVLTLGDHIQALVDPETLAPRSVESRFNTSIAPLNQTAVFDPRTGQIALGTSPPIDSPLGTHTLLSLLYAMRSFNLSLASDPSAAVNDTRVAVFWGNRTLIFSLRPGKQEPITINGQKIMAQPVAVTTGDAQLDALSPRIWLAVDTRIPLRFVAGSLQADLIKN